MEGTVKFFSVERHYGFIATEGGDFFFHGTAVIGEVIKNDPVTFELDEHRGRVAAVNVQRIIEGM